MTDARVLRASDYRRMRWKNGGGETAEISVFPEGAGLDDFDWRVSMARVEGAGPFSAFQGIDHTLTILDGDGMMLSVNGLGTVTLRPSSEPFTFAADAPAHATLVARPITDLNVMSRRGRLAHRVSRLAAPAEVVPQASTSLIFCRSGSVRVADGTMEADLLCFDTFVCEAQAGTVRIVAREPSEILLIEFERAT